MLNFLVPKTKVNCYNMRSVPIETFEVIGIGQINPYCQKEFDNEIFITVVDILGDSRDYDEKEGLVLSEYFTVRRCPKCHRVKLIPTKIRLDVSPRRRRRFDNEETTGVDAYCNFCSSCFEFDIKENDLWLKEAKKLKERNLITGEWEKYSFEN